MHISGTGVQGSSHIDLKKFQTIITIFNRTSDSDLDEHIFKLFDVLKSGKISRGQLQVILFNLPMFGFCLDSNLSKPDSENEFIQKQI